MKIKSVKAIGLKCLSPIMSDAMSICKQRQALWIRVETDDGDYGLGEAFTFGSSLIAGKYIVEEQLAPILVHEDSANIEQLWQKMFWRTVANGRTGLVMSCISGVDIALWDLAGKRAGVPIHTLLGTHSERIPSYASGGFYAPGKGVDELRKEVEEYLKKGYKDIKIKIGRTPDIAGCAVKYTASQNFSVSYEEDIERIYTARECMGKEGRLAADINAAWPTKTVLQAANDFMGAGLNILEEPILFEDEAGLGEIRKVMPAIALMGYETMQGSRNFARVIKEDRVDIVQPDIGWSGGISELRKISATAASFSKPVSLHSFGSCIHFAASLQLAASLPNTEAIESEENPNFLKTGLIKQPFEHDAEMNFIVSSKPGLGIEINWDKVAEVRVF